MDTEKFVFSLHLSSLFLFLHDSNLVKRIWCKAINKLLIKLLYKNLIYFILKTDKKITSLKVYYTGYMHAQITYQYYFRDFSYCWNSKWKRYEIWKISYFLRCSWITWALPCMDYASRLNGIQSCAINYKWLGGVIKVKWIGNNDMWACHVRWAVRISNNKFSATRIFVIKKRRWRKCDGKSFTRENYDFLFSVKLP